MDPMKHNYFRKLLLLHAAGLVPTGCVAEVTYFHDDWCAIYLGGYCNCDPDIQLPITPLVLPPEWN